MCKAKESVLLLWSFSFPLHRIVIKRACLGLANLEWKRREEQVWKATKAIRACLRSLNKVTMFKLKYKKESSYRLAVSLRFKYTSSQEVRSYVPSLPTLDAMAFRSFFATPH